MTEENPTRLSLSRRMRLGAAAIGLLAIGGVAGTVAGHAGRPPIEMAPLRPVAIASLVKTDGIVTIKGRVAEIFGNKFVIDDGSGRTLVDTGREGDDQTLVANGSAVTVQGRFKRGFVHASFLVDQAGKVTALRPMGPMDGPHHGPHGGPDGPDGHRGPPPPRPGDAPPPPAQGDAPPPPPAITPAAH